MSTQPHLDFDAVAATLEVRADEGGRDTDDVVSSGVSLGPAAPRGLTRIENARVRSAQESTICLREGCGKERLQGAKPGLYCSPACRREASRERAREGYLAPRPLPESPTGRRDIGKALAASNNRPQRTIARWAALMCFGADESEATRILRGEARLLARASIASDVRLWCERRQLKLDWQKSWTGSLFHGCPWFEATGTLRNASHAASNARKCFEWRLTEEGREAHRKTREAMGRNATNEKEKRRCLLKQPRKQADQMAA